MNGNKSYPEMKNGVSLIVKVNGKVLDAPVNLLSGRIVREYGKIATAELNFADGDMAEGRFAISDSDDLMIGNVIEVEAGYDNECERLFKGVIVKHALVSKGNISELVITAKNDAFRMTLHPNRRVFQDITDSDIISDVVNEYDIECDVQSTNVQHECVTLMNASDWDFINMRAELNSMLVSTEDDRIMIGRPKSDGEVKLEVNNGSFLFDFEVELEGRHSYPEYVFKCWNPSSQKTEKEKLQTGEGDVKQGNMSSAEIASIQKEKQFEMYVSGTAYDTDVAALAASSQMYRHNMSRIIGKFEIYGNASLHLGDLIDIQRIGDKFNGVTIVTALEHTFEQGAWYTEVSFGLEDTPYARKYDDINSIEAGGMVPAVHGLQYATVVQLSDDPMDEERILIQLSQLEDSVPAIWARLALADAGKERGTVFRPEIGDEVVVGFIDDNPSCAVILGAVHSSANVSPVKPDDSNHIKGIYTREKIKFEFDDDNKSVLIETPGGNKFMLSDDKKGISLEDQNGNKIVMDDKGITIESKKAVNIKTQNDVNVEGTNVTVCANASFKAEGKASAEVSSTGNTVVKGSLVSIN